MDESNSDSSSRRSEKRIKPLKDARSRRLICQNGWHEALRDKLFRHEAGMNPSEWTMSQSMAAHGRNRMNKKTRKRNDREFKISIITEHESGKPLAQISRKHGIPVFLPVAR